MTPLRLLFVCTGNICRSASAQFLLRSRLEERLGDAAKLVEISSAGMGTPGGWEIDPTIAELLARTGIEDTAGFRSRPLDAALLADADLVLTGTKQHRLGVGADFPEAYAKTFTMREAVTLLSHVDVDQLPALDLLERAHAVVAELKRQRGVRPVADHHLDIADPYGRSAAAYERMLHDVRGVTDVLAFVLAPATLWPRPNP